MALAAAAFVVLAGVIVIVRDKEGKIIAWIRGEHVEVQQESPDGTPEPASDEETDDIAGRRASSDPDRLAAAFVVSIGGTFSCKFDGRIISVSGLSQIPSVPFQVTAVGLQKCQEITPANIKVLSELRDVESIDLSESNITDEAIAFLNGLPNLQTLGLEGTAVTGAGLEQLDSLPQLVLLSLANSDVKGDELGVVAHFPSLLHIRLGRRQLTAGAGRSLQRLHQAVYLASDVGDMECDALANAQFDGLTADGTRITDDGVRLLRALPNLDGISLDDTRLSDVGLGYLAEMDKVQAIGIARTRISDAGLAKLSSRRNLTALDLIGCDISDEGVRHLLVQRSLETLWLNDTQITDAGVGLLRELRHLSHLRLGSTAITDAALVDIGAITTLAKLGLDNTKVTDAGLKHLTSLTNLTQLDLQYTHVTAAGVAELQAALPKCQIIWSTADSASPADRRAADWALRLGGQVTVLLEGQFRKIAARDKLPSGIWRAWGIHLEGKQGITREGLENLAGSNIAGLLLDETDVTDDALLALRGVHRLRLLALRGTQITDVGIRNAGALRTLFDLNVSRTSVSDAGLEELLKCDRLWHLAVDGKQLTPRGVATVAKLLAVTNLSVEDAGAEELGRVGSLTRPTALFIVTPQLDDAAIEAISQMRQLTNLSLWTDLHDADLKPLATLPLLEGVNLNNGAPRTISDRNFEDLAQVKGLSGLSIGSRSEIVGSGLRHLRGHEKLQHLILTDEKIDDAAMAHLAGIPNLANLNLSGIPTMTDAGLKQLHGLTKLISLDINGTNVTAEGVEAFKQANPKCQVNWTPPDATTAP